ncbi:MAG TPA: alpha/beta fold hydrolase [Xanthobacteraceae bacterium]|nr:alpha/beta fold hydrolase [Xanthobacteraceae bacterium]
MLFTFETCSLDIGRRELRRGPALVAVEPQVFDLLVYLVQNRDRVVSKDDLIASVWGGRIVSESTLNSRINAARKAIGDTGKEQRLIRTAPRKGFRFVGALDDNAARSAEPSQRHAATALRQDIRFCTASDGVRIAYAEVGSGPPLVKAANWLNHLEYDWESPIWRGLLRELATGNRLIRHDQRGNGLSDWEVEDMSFEAMVQDLESVVDAAGVKKFPLLGISQGCAISIAYAVRHPERVSGLVLYGGFARGRRKRGSPMANAEADALVTLIRVGWGQENPAFRQIFTSQFIPDGTAEQVQWFNNLQRVTASPENAIRIMETMANIDVTDLLPRISVPTLVLHCRHDARAAFEEGRLMAAGIPGAHFVALEGKNHLILETEPAWARFLDEVRAFLKNQADVTEGRA